MIRLISALTAVLLSTSALAETAEAPKVETPKAEAAKADAAKTDATTGAQAAASKEVVPLKEFTYVPKDSDVVFGKEDAPVTLVEYASLSCPHCAAFYIDVFPELKRKYIDTGKVKLVYRNFPLNQPAMEAAQMLACADKESRATYIKVLFTTQPKWAYDVNYHESLAGIAVLGGMDRKKFDDCIANKDGQTNILLIYQEAKDTFKVSSTPTLFVGSEQIKGNHSVASVSKALDAALAAAAKK